MFDNSFFTPTLGFTCHNLYSYIGVVPLRLLSCRVRLCVCVCVCVCVCECERQTERERSVPGNDALDGSECVAWIIDTTNMCMRHWLNNTDRVGYRTRGKTCPKATSSTPIFTWTNLTSNPHVRNEKAGTKRLSNGPSAWVRAYRYI
jgi:hypothetical protein